MNDKHIHDIAKTALEQQANALDSETLQRLRHAREAALMQNTQNQKSGWLNALSWKWLTGAGAGLAIASILTFMIVPQLSTNTLSPLDDLELLTAEVDMDLVNQLEFYQWLDESLDES